MPDISMCANKECELSKTCYRHTAKPSGYQAYAGFKPEVKNGITVCLNYISAHNKIKT